MRAGRALGSLAAAALLLGGCGGGEEEPAAKPGAADTATGEPVGPETAGSVTQYADCADWRAGSPADRRATVVVLRSQLTPQTSEIPRSALTEDRAYEILQKACRPDYAGSLRLYKLFVRAQGFAPLND